MHTRPLQVDDYPAAGELLIATFRPYFEDYLRPLLGEPLFTRQHGQWAQDYRDELPELHVPESGRHAVVVPLADGTITGLVSWRFDNDKPDHGEIYLLAVSPSHRRQQIGRRLCEHAIDQLRGGGANVVGIGTGGDPFHAPARALYASLGLTPTPGVWYLGAL